MNLTFCPPLGTNEWILNASTIGLSHLKCHLDNLELVNCKVFCEILKDSFIASKCIRAMRFGKVKSPEKSILWTLNYADFKFPICDQNVVFWLCSPHGLHKITVLQNVPKINPIKLKLSCCLPFMSTYLMQMLTFGGMLALVSEMCSVLLTLLNH